VFYELSLICSAKYNKVINTEIAAINSAIIPIFLKGI
tara:strand:+ start:690 stop:800 length:111 start_codon:yes stop_codon:yes gene_type:complete